MGEEHGDAKVSAIYDRDPQLGKWVRSQRANYKNKKLSEERTRELNSIGFDWVLPRGSHRSWDKMYQRFIAYNNDSNNNIDTSTNTNLPQREVDRGVAVTKLTGFSRHRSC